MSLRLRLFLLLGTLVALLVAAQWWMIHALSEDLSQEVRVVALNTAQSTVEVIAERLPPGQDSHKVSVEIVATQGDPDDPQGKTVRRHHYAYTTDSEEELELPTELSAAEVEDLRLRLEERLQELDIDPEDPKHQVKVHMVHKTTAEEGGSPPILVLRTPEGMREIPIPEHPVERRVKTFRERMLAGTLAILALGLLFAGVVAHRVSAPLRRLAGAARQVGEGRLGEQVPGAGSGEVGQAITAFNHMSHRLAVLEDDARRLRGQQHLSELGEVARGLAHTLRNPLNALGLSVEEMATASDDNDLAGKERRTELAESARRQIRRMDGAVRSILALASGGAGKAEPVQVGELAQDVALEALQDGGQDGRKVRIEVEVEPDLPPLPAVAPELRAVLQALVVNAVEAGPPGGRVTVRVQSADGGAVRVEVNDEGPGVAPQVRDRLFTPHVSTKAHGSGMGLFLAQRIATNRYDGSVRLEDRPEGGTRAVLTLGPRVELQGSEGAAG